MISWAGAVGIQHLLRFHTKSGQFADNYSSRSADGATTSDRAFELEPSPALCGPAKTVPLNSTSRLINALTGEVESPQNHMSDKATNQNLIKPECSNGPSDSE